MNPASNPQQLSLVARVALIAMVAVSLVTWAVVAWVVLRGQRRARRPKLVLVASPRDGVEPPASRSSSR